MGGRREESWEPFGSRESRTDRQTDTLPLAAHANSSTTNKEAERLQRRRVKQNKTSEARLKRHKFSICATDLLTLVFFSQPDVWIGS